MQCLHSRVMLRQVLLKASLKFKTSSKLLNSSRTLSTLPEDRAGMKLSDVVSRLEAFAPSTLAESWDNVGLLLEPTSPRPVATVMLTNDLTESVLEESMAKKADLIVSYHPPLFSAVKKFKVVNWKDRIALRCVENGVAVYSPHTAWDCVQGGVADWLIQAVGAGKVDVLQPSTNPKLLRGPTHCVFVNAKLPDSALSNLDSASVSSFGDNCSVVNCSETALSSVLEAIGKLNVACGVHVTKLERQPVPNQGIGRIKTLEKATPLGQIVELVKKHIGSQTLRLALASNSNQDAPIRTVACCPGSGSSVLSGCKADLWLTGEMSHHELLDATHRGTSVILCEHSNSERGFLGLFKGLLEQMLDPNVSVIVSDKDKDPVTFV